MLFNHSVNVQYECRYGLLVSAGYYHIPKHLEDRILTGLREKYGSAATTKGSGIFDDIIYVLKQGQQIRYSFTLERGRALDYSDTNLTRFLEKKEALKAAASGEL